MQNKIAFNQLHLNSTLLHENETLYQHIVEQHSGIMKVQYKSNSTNNYFLLLLSYVLPYAII